MTTEFRYYQEEADNAIYEELLINNKCIVKMFCGTGKSLLMRNCKTVKDKKLVVYVFPSLSLIDQFCSDYLNDIPIEKVLRICSENEATTDPSLIQQFLSRKNNKIICITYQSFGTLLENLGEIKINVCIFDEAHHAVGETYQKLIFENDDCEKQIFFTATPKNVPNGIIMYDREKLDDGMCGKLVYDYSYLRGVEDGYLNPIEIRIDMFSENDNKSVYESIARAILTSGNNRVLTFHSDVNTDRDTSVNNFVNEAQFKCSFHEVLEKEFPEKVGYYVDIVMIGLSSRHSGIERKRILNKFDRTPNNRIFVISSCETIGEGIDTKNANMCVFVDPKSSYVKIIQNIGRIVRKQFGVDKPNSTVLIPCWVDKSKYLECNGDKDKCDEVIRQDMSADGNFNGILNVLSALKQEDEELYDICLHYPDTYSPQEIKSNLEKQGYKIAEQVGEGTLMETMEHLLEAEIDYENYEDCETDEDMIMNIAEDNDVCIEIHTNSLENPVERYNSECETGEIIRVYKSFDEDLEEDIYSPIIKKEKGTKRNSGFINGPKRENRTGVKVHTNPDIKVLWNITSVLDLTKDICSCVIDCEVIDNWYDNFEELKKFIDENGRRPSQREQKTGYWLSNQQQNYKNKKGSMKDQTKYNLWMKFLEEYKEYFKNIDEIWDDNFEELKNFIDTHKQKPTRSINAKLNQWLESQRTHYRKKDNGMINEQRYNEWTKFMENYQEYFKNIDEKWRNNFDLLKKFMDEYSKRPNKRSMNKYEKSLGVFLTNNTKAYKTQTNVMKDANKYNLWTTFLEKYKEYLKSDHDNWYETFTELKQFMYINKRRPSQGAEEQNEKQLSSWISNQQIKYKNKKGAMKDVIKYDIWNEFLEKHKEYLKTDDDIWYETFTELKQFVHARKQRPTPSINKKLNAWFKSQSINYKNKNFSMKDENKYNLWTQFLEKYKEYFKSVDDNWYENLEQVKSFINKNKKRPSSHSKDEHIKSLGSWIVTQTKNYKNKINNMQLNVECKNTRQKLEEFIEKYRLYFNNVILEKHLTNSIIEDDDDEEEFIIIPKPKKSMKLKKTVKKEESVKQKRERVKTEISQLHQRYKTLKSENLHIEFNEQPELWHKYHEISEENEKSFPEDEIPRNRIIQELLKIKTKRTKIVVDMGCGKGQIAEYFKTDKRFQFINYDHISSNDTVISCDISNTPLEEDAVEICILSLAMWGSNCKEYICEANRILESNGKLYIIEPTKRWSEQDENGNIIPEKEGMKLKEELEKNGFKIDEQSIEKFCMFVCIKK